MPDNSLLHPTTVRFAHSRRVKSNSRQPDRMSEWDWDRYGWMGGLFTGGFRMDRAVLLTLRAFPDRITLTGPFIETIVLPRACVQRISGVRWLPLFLTGIRVEHDVVDLPMPLIFLATLRWSPKPMLDAFRELGYVAG